MERLFTKHLTHPSTITSRNFITSKRIIRSNFFKALEYYQNNSVVIDNSHTLVKLLYNLPPTEYSTAILTHTTKLNIDRVAASVGICTPYNVGSSTESPMYNSHTYYISMEFNTPALKANEWKRISPVKVLTHDLTVLKYTLPVNDKLRPGVSVIGIDIPKLAVMYKGWVEQNEKLTYIEREGVNQFISKWVLPTLLESQLEVAIRNRYIALSNDIRAKFKARDRPPFAILDANSMADKGIHTVLNTLKQNNLDYIRALSSIPMVFSDNYYLAVPKQITPLIMHSYWLGIITYQRWLDIIVGKNVNINTSGTLQSDLKRVDRYLKGSGANRYITGSLKVYHTHRYNKLLKWVK